MHGHDIAPLPEPAALLVQAAHRLKDGRKYLAAYAAARRALALAPGHVVPTAAVAATLWNMQEWDRAAVLLEECVEKAPQNPNYWGVLALCYASLRRDDDAEVAFAKALELIPTEAAASIADGDMQLAEVSPQAEAGILSVKWNRANARLARGDWERGFEDYESRIKHRGPPVFPDLPYDRWKGEDLSGKTIVIHGEQGVGDTILSSRYLPLIKQRWPDCRIIWFVQPRLHDLFWEFRDIAEMWPAGYPWPKADYGILQMSLLEVFGQRPDKIVADPGLLRKRAERTKDSFVLMKPLVPSLKVGIAWTGSPDMLANSDRSIPLELLLELAENPTITLYSLQVGAGSEDISAIGCGDLIRDCTPDLAKWGFPATAAMMLHLDLVITVCTSSAHLAGALGVPCWTLLCREPYWVWGRDAGSTPFYPRSRLFRQQRAGDWFPVIDDVKAALAELASTKLSAAA